jgi:hypothetical protein
VVVHFVTTHWELEKRIIGFRLIDCSHSGVNIAERISLVLAEYDLISKVLFVTLDNASANASAMDHFIFVIICWLYFVASVLCMPYYQSHCKIWSEMFGDIFGGFQNNYFFFEPF